MARKRKMWSFRLNDTTTLDVSAAPEATRTQIRRRGRWSLVVGMLLAMLAVGALTASSAELVTAEVTSTTNDVTVTQGTSVNSTINLSATGAFDCAITSSNPSTAKMDTSFALSSTGSLTASNLSSAMNFYGNGVPNPTQCGPAWVGSPTPYSVTASFSAAATTPVGNYTVTLSTAAGTTVVTNPSGASAKLGDTTATTITVHVVAPVVTNTAPTVTTAANDANGNEGDTLTTSGAFQDADGDTLAISETSGAGSVTDNGDGTWSWSLPTTDQTTGSVTVSADDGHGHSVSDSFNYSAVNVAPTAAITGAPSSSPEGTQISLGSTVTDPSSADTAAGFAYAWSVKKNGNAFATGSGSTFSFTPDDNGSYVVSFSATDKDGATGNATDATTTVTNVAPTGTFNSPSAHVNEGSSFNLSISGVTDPSTVDTNAGFQYAFDCGDGNGYSAFSSTSSVSCSTVNGPATLNVGGKVEDKDGGVSISTGTVTVDNVAPTVSALTLGGATGTACGSGNNVTLDFGFSDPGLNDNPWAVDIDWGDGSTHMTYNTATQGSQPQQSHSYGVGSFTISVSVTDKDGGVGSKNSANNAVSHLYAMTGILAPFNSDGSSVWKYGSTVPVKVQITDCTGAPVSGLAPQVGTSLVSSTDPTITIDETASTSAADTTGVMRYDSTAGQYIYNFGTKYLSDPSATYYMTVKGTDSSGNTVTSPPMVQRKFGLKSK